MTDNFPADAVNPVGYLSIAPNNQELVAEQRRVVQAVQYLNRTQLSGDDNGARFRFSLDQGANRTVVEVVDGGTGQVLYQVPADEVIRLAAEARRARRQTASEE